MQFTRVRQLNNRNYMFLDPRLYEGLKFLLLVLTCAPHVPSACKIWIFSLCRLQPKFFLVISGYQSNCLFLPIWTMWKHEKSHPESVSYHIGYGFKVAGFKAVPRPNGYCSRILLPGAQGYNSTWGSHKRIVWILCLSSLWNRLWPH